MSLSTRKVDKNIRYGHERREPLAACSLTAVGVVGGQGVHCDSGGLGVLHDSGEGVGGDREDGRGKFREEKYRVGQDGMMRRGEREMRK
jgi:hypothetical protein